MALPVQTPCKQMPDRKQGPALQAEPFAAQSSRLIDVGDGAAVDVLDGTQVPFEHVPNCELLKHVVPKGRNGPA